MALLEVPTDESLLFYRQRSPIEGRNYTFSFRYNSRDQSYYLAILDEEQTPLVQSIRLVLGENLLISNFSEERPPGFMICFDASGQGLEAGRFDLGNRVTLLYLESESD